MNHYVLQKLYPLYTHIKDIGFPAMQIAKVQYYQCTFTFLFMVHLIRKIFLYENKKTIG